MNSEQIFEVLNKLIEDSDYEVDYTIPSNFDTEDLYKFYELIEIYREINLNIHDKEKRLYAFYLTDLYAELEGFKRISTQDLITSSGKYKTIDIEKGMFESKSLVITENGNFHVEGLMKYTEFTYDDVCDVLYNNKFDIIKQNKHMIEGHWVDATDSPIFTVESFILYNSEQNNNPITKKYIEIMLKTIDLCRLAPKNTK